MSEQDEAFRAFWDAYGQTHSVSADEWEYGYMRIGWDASHEHDAAELARKDELLKAYRALNAAGVRLYDGNKTESEWSSRAKEWRAAQAKVAELEAGR